ncbi:metal-sensitive transcriptional regulator [Corynebacterium sp. HS2168-gen11]|uniref:metal-sensitive transcriptional regulator n=1 Tax=Corynebacterium sp. HS2168-gen11 TaxID=2974027 RepID=UPI00216ACAAC|nr:metal-sensitive transcriptional regulator [Corynebacterium sp. HS2168-gen11]MCS4534771.1 metal-sensitive transcriptional regulator [Corynebacterium sp. HS2168-gen11]
MHLKPEEITKSITRLKRAQGQLAAVIRMLEEGEQCDAAITQLAAVSKAIDKAGFTIISSGLKKCLTESQDSEVDLAKLEKLFLSLS